MAEAGGQLVSAAAGLTHLLHGLLHSIFARVVVAKVAHHQARLAAQFLDLCSFHTQLHLLRVEALAQTPELLELCTQVARLTRGLCDFSDAFHTTRELCIKDLVPAGSFRCRPDGRGSNSQ